MRFKRFTAALFAFAVLFVSLVGSASSSPAPVKVYADGDFGESVVRIQLRLRELGYLCYRPTGVYRAMTVKAAEEFQKRCSAYGINIAVDGKMGPESMQKLFSREAPRVRIPDSVHMPRGPIADRLKVFGTAMDWSDVKQIMRVGITYAVTDCNTGSVFYLIYSGGENHAEMELADEDQKAVFDSICGGEYNYLKRPVVVEVNGNQIAASIQCWPHGDYEKANNGMEGHVCVFFEGSLSHVGNLPDVEHNANIYQASGR